MAQATSKQMIATFLRQSRPQIFRNGRSSRLPQRSLATAATLRPQAAEREGHIEWQSHPLTSVESHTPTPATRIQRLRNETNPKPFSSFLTDNYAREHNYLRISLTERCNLRCLYCMPEEGIQLSPPEHILTTPEIVYLSSLFVNQGVNKIRLTGGEPTVRKDILDLMRQIGQLRSNGLKELCLTTNGISLHRKLDSMVESGLTGVNLSLDTLDPFQFTIMTRRNGHEAVMKSINRILEMNNLGAGIKLKINCVVMRGLNEKEIVPFVELGKEKDLEVRFIEYMPFDGNKWSQKKMMTFKEMLALIRERYPEVYKVQDHPNDTSKTYKVPGFAGRIGFITSMTHNFCGTCNRLRITSDGNLKVCLFGNSEVSLRDILREFNNGKPIDTEAMEAMKQLESDRKQGINGSTGVLGISDREAKLLNVIGMAVKRKKERHAGMGELENMKNRPMILIDEHVRTQPYRPVYRVQSQLRAQSSLLSIRSSSVFSKTVPTRLLSYDSQSPMFQQRRYSSTFLRKRTHLTRNRLTCCIWRISTNQQIEFYPLQRSKSTATPGCKGQFKRNSMNALHDVARNAHFGTTAIQGKADNQTQKHSLTHLTSSGAAHMVNIGHKNETKRSATAIAHLLFSVPITYATLIDASLQKGDALAVARIAGIQAAKKTADLIPLAHPSLSITAVTIDIDAFPPRARPNTYIPRGQETPSTEKPGSDSTTPSPQDPTSMKSDHGGVSIKATVQCHGKTGIEMEALTAANVAALTMYDMLKGIDKGMVITGCRVTEKKGGKSGWWKWDDRNQTIEKVEIEPSTSVEAPRQVDNAVESEHTASPTTFDAVTTLRDAVDDDANSAQAVFEAEWHDLSATFTPRGEFQHVTKQTSDSAGSEQRSKSAGLGTDQRRRRESK